jgi:hypothetical protein
MSGFDLRQGQDLTARLGREIQVGPMSVLCSFSQIYDRNRSQLEELVLRNAAFTGAELKMPMISDAAEVIRDISTVRLT